MITKSNYFNENFDYCLLKQASYGIQSIHFNKNGMGDAVMTVEKCEVPLKMKSAILICKNADLMNDAKRWIKSRSI